MRGGGAWKKKQLVFKSFISWDYSYQRVFNQEYALEEENITAYVHHMEELKRSALSRARENNKCNKAEIFHRLWRETSKKWQTAFPDKTAALSKSLQTFLKMEGKMIGCTGSKVICCQRFSNDYLRTNTEAITPPNYNRSKQRDEPITIPSSYLKLAQSAGGGVTGKPLIARNLQTCVEMMHE